MSWFWVFKLVRLLPPPFFALFPCMFAHLSTNCCTYFQSSWKNKKKRRVAVDLITVVYIIGRKLQNNTTYYWKCAFYGGIFLPFNRLLVCYIPQHSSRVQLIHELCQGTTPSSGTWKPPVRVCAVVSSCICDSTVCLEVCLHMNPR